MVRNYVGADPNGIGYFRAIDLGSWMLRICYICRFEVRKNDNEHCLEIENILQIQRRQLSATVTLQGGATVLVQRQMEGSGWISGTGKASSQEDRRFIARTAYLNFCLLLNLRRCGSTEKGFRLVSGHMLARIQSSALATELPVWITSTNNESI